MQHATSRNAFTLTEVLVVMMMMAILVSLVLYATSGGHPVGCPHAFPEQPA